MGKHGKQGQGAQGRKKKARVEKPQPSGAIILHNEKDKADQQLVEFLTWAHAGSFALSDQVAVTSEGVAHGRGMLAIKDLPADLKLFDIPRKHLLSPNTCSIKKELEEFFNTRDGASKAQGDSDEEEEEREEDEEDEEEEGGMPTWPMLLLSLMHERTLGSASAWAPYLNVLPSFDSLLHPHFWPTEELQALLRGTRLDENVASDLKTMREEYENIALPFIEKYPGFFNEETRTFETYSRFAAIVMAYSFTDDQTGQVCMAPMADILNHRTGCNNARLFYEEDCLQMITTQPVKAGEEVWNTYGELDNAELLHKHGFVEAGPTLFEDFGVEIEELVKFVPQDVMGDKSLSYDKKMFLDDCEIGFDALLHLTRLEVPDAPPKDRILLEVLNLFVAPKDKFDSAKESLVEALNAEGEEDEEEGEEGGASGESEVTPAAKGVLRALCESKLAVLREGEAAAEAFAAGASAERLERCRLAAVVRASKIAVLEEWLHWCSQ